MPNALGPTLLMVCFLAATGITVLCLAVYVARCVLVVVEGTAGGADRVRWPDEPMIDWAFQSLTLIGLAVLLLVPAGILAAVLGSVLWPDQPGLRTLVLGGLTLWLLFPIGALSALSEGSRWAFFRPVIVARMVRLFPATAQFYLIGFGVAFLALCPWYVAVRRQSLLLLLVACPIGAAMVLIYARLLGQLAWRIVQLGPLPSGKAARRRKGRRAAREAADWPPPPSSAVRDHNVVYDVEPRQGSAIPKSPTGLLEVENLVPYELAGNNNPTPVNPEEKPLPRLRPLDPEEEDALKGYGLAELPPSQAGTSAALPIPSVVYAEPAKDWQPGAAPLQPTLAGALIFPWYESSLAAWLVLSFLAVVLGLLVIQLLQS
jgi:hypothetical protein